MSESTCIKELAFQYNDFPVLESHGNASVSQNFLTVQDLYSYQCQWICCRYD